MLLAFWNPIFLRKRPKDGVIQAAFPQGEFKICYSGCNKNNGGDSIGGCSEN
jgi:hypothetical protein